MGFFRGLSLLFLLSSTFAFGKNSSCGDTISPLGGQVSVPSVEAINQANGGTLLKYTGESSVQSQLGVDQNFGFVAVVDTEVVGFIVVERRAQFLNIRSVAVAENMREKGIGGDLVGHVILQAKEMQGINDVRALVAVSDAGIKTFFTKVGLVEVEVIPHRFNRQTESGVLLKINVGRDQQAGAYVPQLQLAPKPQLKPKATAVVVMGVTYEELLKIDPTIINSR